MKNWETLQGIYIHIPFCLQKCLYCDFASLPRQDTATMEAYTLKLCQEILTRPLSLPVEPQATIYFGGGTPSLLPVEFIAKIVAALKKRGLWQRPAEATLEANPGTLTAAKLKTYKQLGFDRLSLGIQSLQDNELKVMGRIHNKAEALEAITLARKNGFLRLSGDLIYGYPTQTLVKVQNSLQQLVQTGLQHISIYGLTVEKGTALAKLLDQGKLHLPTEDVAGDMYDYVTTYLPKQGLLRYEISNFAVKGQESKHNQIYWQYLPYLGLGAAACSFDGRQRYTNPSLKAYLAGKSAEREELPWDIKLSECIFMGLRTKDGIQEEYIKERFGIKLTEKYAKELKECLQEGLLVREAENNSFHLTEQGMRYGNQVFEKFL